jgi:hypothetical protein
MTDSLFEKAGGQIARHINLQNGAVIAGADEFDRCTGYTVDTRDGVQYYVTVSNDGTLLSVDENVPISMIEDLCIMRRFPFVEGNLTISYDDKGDWFANGEPLGINFVGGSNSPLYQPLVKIHPEGEHEKKYETMYKYDEYVRVPCYDTEDGEFIAIVLSRNFFGKNLSASYFHRGSSTIHCVTSDGLYIRALRGPPFEIFSCEDNYIPKIIYTKCETNDNENQDENQEEENDEGGWRVCWEDRNRWEPIDFEKDFAYLRSVIYQSQSS